MTDDRSRTEQEAYRRYIAPLRRFLGCITQQRLTINDRSPLLINTPYAIALNEMNPVRLQGDVPLWLTVGQRFQLVSLGADVPRGKFTVHTLSYLYALSTTTGEELFAFHYTDVSPGTVTFPHFHIGSALLGATLPLRSGTLHKAHIPTGRVSIESVIRLLIVEFGITPITRDWEEMLRTAEDAFNTHRSG